MGMVGDRREPLLDCVGLMSHKDRERPRYLLVSLPDDQVQVGENRAMDLHNEALTKGDEILVRLRYVPHLGVTQLPVRGLNCA